MDLNSNARKNFDVHMSGAKFTFNKWTEGEEGSSKRCWASRILVIVIMGLNVVPMTQSTLIGSCWSLITEQSISLQKFGDHKVFSVNAVSPFFSPVNKIRLLDIHLKKSDLWGNMHNAKV